jgi:membrane-associated protease RseP (regulator of RpoE activity)
VKEFLSERNVPFTEYDVSRDQAAAQEMVQLSQQRGVPVTLIGSQTIVGFDRPALERALASEARPGFGAAVADVTGGSGAYVGRVRPGSPASNASLQTGDVIVEFNKKPVKSAADLERAVAASGGYFSLVFTRAGVRRGAEGRLQRS